MKESLKIKERVIELHKLINFHSYNYHSLDSPSIEDHEYDALFEGNYYSKEIGPDIEERANF